MDPTLIREYAEFLRDVPLFVGLDRMTLAKVAAHLAAMSVEDGTVIVREGDPPDGLYLVRRGRLRVTRSGPPGAGEAVLSNCAPGETFGEIGLITGEARSASVRADGDTEVLWLEQARFHELAQGEPSVALAVAAQLVQRLRVADRARSGLVTPSEVDDAAATDSRRAEASSGRAQRVSAVDRLSVGPAKARPWRRPLGIALASLALVAGWVAPPPAELDVAGWRALTSLVSTVPLFATGAIPDGAVALFLAGAWAVGGAAPLATALGGFTTGSWLLMLTILTIGAATAATGLLFRLALLAATHARIGFRGQVTALGCIGLLISPAFPDATGRTALVASATTELVEALGYAPGTRAAVGLAMAVLVGFGLTTAPFLTSSSSALLTYAVLPEATRTGLDWATWAVRAAPAYLILFPGMLAAVMWLYRPEVSALARPAESEQRRAIVALQRALLQTPTHQECIAAVVALVLVIGFLSAPFHFIPPWWIGLVAFLLLAATGVLNTESVRAVNWNLLLVFGVLASTPQVFAGTGLNAWLGGLVSGSLQQLVATPVMFVPLLAMVCVGLNLLLRTPAPFVTLAFAPIASSAGIDPWVVAFVALVASNNFVFAYQSNPYQALQFGTGGHLFAEAQTRPLASTHVVLVLVALGASVPVWHAMGLL